jgi:hypothetical protein
MTADLDLDPQQREELARLLGGATLGSLLQEWGHFVTAVERGYDDSIYEYTNDLSVRDRLERVVAGASPGLRGQLEQALAADDGRFEAATEDAERPLGATYTTWWWRRVPRRRVGELADDLRAQS